MAEVSDLTKLRAALSGYLIEPREEAYDQARRVWNGMIDRRPAAIARCATVTDAVRCVEFARTCDMTVAIRGGGHNVAGNALCDGGLVIDLSLMKEIVVDAPGRRVRAGGGVVWGELDAATQQHGLATTGGLMSTTGIAGFTLGGGLGNLMRSYGLACDNLLSAQLVTADGRELMVSGVENSDLFWALRGGGGNFGVVNPLAAAPDTLRFYREVTTGAADALMVYANLGHGPDGSPRVGMRSVFNGPVAAGEEAVRKLRGFGSPIADEIRPRSYVEIQRLVDPNFPAGRLNYWKAHFLAELSDELIDLVVEAFRRVPSRYSG